MHSYFLVAIQSALFLMNILGSDALGEQIEHQNATSGITFTNQGKTLVSTSWDQQLMLRDPSTAKCLRTLKSENGWIMSMAKSPSTEVLATANFDGTITLWDTVDWKTMGQLKGHVGPVLDVVYSSDGKRLISCGRDRRIIVWDVANRSIEFELTGHTQWVESLTLTTDATTLVSGDWEGTIAIWDLQHRKLITKFKGHDDAVLCLALSPSEDILVSGAQDKMPLKLWNTKDWKEKGALEGHKSSVRCVLFLSDDEIISGSNDRSIRIWDLGTGKSRIAWSAFDHGWVTCLALSQDRMYLASGDSTGKVKVWKLSEKYD